MYKKLLLILSLVVSFSLAFAPAALASEDTPVLGCPKPGFELMQWMPDHDMHHEGHIHVVIEGDTNGDGWICVKHVFTRKGEVHIHIDNSGPLTK